MADELPTFGDDVALNQEINGKITAILNSLHDDILDIIQTEQPPTAQPAQSGSAAPTGPSGASNAASVVSGGDGSNMAGGGISNAFGGSVGSSGGSSEEDGSGSGGGSTFWRDLWGGTKKVLGGLGRGAAALGRGAVRGAEALGRGADNLFNKSSNSSVAGVPSSPLTTKLGYGLGGAWGNFKRGWDKGAKYRGRAWESYCSEKITDILFKEECQDYFQLFNENQRISLADYSKTSDSVNYYIEEALYAYLSELDWSNTFLENLPSDPIGVTPVNGAAPSPEPQQPQAAVDPLAELKQKIMAKIGKYRAQIANLLKDYAAKLVPAAPAAAAAVPEKPKRKWNRRPKPTEPQAVSQSPPTETPAPSVEQGGSVTQVDD